jgi:hypothetical protein
MSEIKPGSIIYNNNPSVEIKGEMTLRDYFAAQAMLGMYGDSYDLDTSTRAEFAYEMADVMLKQRMKK